MGAPGGPPRGPASETKHSRPRNATGWGPREHETTQPKPRARLAGGPLGPPKSIAKAHSRYQERDWLGAPRGRPDQQRPAHQRNTTETRSASPGCRQNRRDPANAKTQGRNHEDDGQRPPAEAHAHKAPEHKNTHSRSQEHDWLGTPGAGHVHSTRERKKAQPKSRAGLPGGSIA